MKFSNGQLITDISDAEVIQEGQDMAEFAKLAEKYRHHDGEECPDSKCLVCEAIGWIVNGQSDIAEARYNRNYDHALDNGMVF